jgi:MYXO-CTERM domain-containing protein
MDAITRDAADVLPTLVEAELITIQPVYQTEVSVGDRVLFGLDAGGSLTGHVFPVSAQDMVSCSMTFGHDASVTEASGWLLSEAGQCRSALEKKGWMEPCDDTRESCAVAPAAGNGAHTGWALVLGVAALGWICRRR